MLFRSPISQPSPIRTFLGSLESSHQGLFNGPCLIKMRPANKNAPTPVHFPSSNLLFSISSQPINFFSPTNTLIVLIISYLIIYISSQTTHNSMSNSLFNAFSSFAYNKPTTTAINTFLPPFESSHQPLSNDMFPVQMRPAVQNAKRIQR